MKRARALGDVTMARVSDINGILVPQLPNAVRMAFRVCSSPQFFMRIAEQADQATDEVTKEKLSALASNLVATLDAVVSTTEEQLDERAKEVQNILAAAAEPDSGEFLVPLIPERIQASKRKFSRWILPFWMKDSYRLLMHG